MKSRATTKRKTAASDQAAAPPPAPAPEPVPAAAPREVKPETARPPEPLRMLHIMPPYHRLVGILPPNLVAVPSMMSVPEKRLLHGLARTQYTGEGLIIDGGIFLGASTCCFGEGVRANANFDAITKRWKKPVISFERGLVNPNMLAFFKRNNVPVTAATGESFADEVRKNVAPVMDLVDLRFGDIMETAKDVDDPIEILFLDVLKFPEISRFAIRQFFPKLIPNVSFVIQQDYFYERLPYIKTDQEFFGEYFTYLGEIGSTALFLCTKQIPMAAIDKLEAGVTPEEQERLASVATQRSIDPSRRFMMALSKVRLILKLRGKQAAQDYLNFVKQEYPEQVADQRHARVFESLAEVEKLCK